MRGRECLSHIWVGLKLENPFSDKVAGNPNISFPPLGFFGLVVWWIWGSPSTKAGATPENRNPPGRVTSFEKRPCRSSKFPVEPAAGREWRLGRGASASRFARHEDTHLAEFRSDMIRTCYICT